MAHLGVLLALLVAGTVAWSRRGPSAGRRPVAASPSAGGRARRGIPPRAPGGGTPLRAVRRGSGERGAPSARWARPADLRALRCAGIERGRLVIGAQEGPVGRAHVLAAEPNQSLAVIGPTQSGKTTALAVPAILGWDGPVLAASVKTDLVRDTWQWRSRCGSVWCFDPTGTTELPRSYWSPLSAASTWPGARRVAADLTQVTRSEGTSADGEFWYATATKLLAPLLFAAAAGGRTMRDVVRWVDTQETEEVLDILHAAGVPEAVQAARATWLRDDRQRSAVYTTAETVLEPFAEPGLLRAEPACHAAGPRCHPAEPGLLRAEPDPGVSDTPPYGIPAVTAGHPGAVEGAGGAIVPEELISGSHTLYVCAPAHDQRRLRAVFAALVEQVVRAAFAAASRRGSPLDPPLLVVLDEAANIAPLADLDGLAATCAGHGVQLVTVWQDLAQIRARYGERAATVVNNHRAKLFLPGIADPATLDFASHLAGDQEVTTPSVTVGTRGERTVTTSSQVRRLLPPDTLRRLPRGTGVLLYGSLPPTRLRLRSWFSDAQLALRGGRTGSALAAPKGLARRRGGKWPGRPTCTELRHNRVLRG